MAANFIHDTNPYGLEIPPKWWLDALYGFDDQLVVIPSRMQPLYRLARRKHKSPGIGPLAILDPQADTAMLASYGLVPVTSITTFGVWTLSFLNELRARDIWAAGGADKMVDNIEAMEEREKQRKRQAFRDEIYHRAGDAWRSLQARTGSRNKRSSDRTTSTARKIELISSTELPADVRGVPSGSTASVGRKR